MALFSAAAPRWKSRPSRGCALSDGFRLRELPATPVKGKAEPIVTFALAGVDGDAP